ncbi:MAG: pilus assembly protein PilM [Opitutae bacterium]|nr:pilus assembly protein PilM [Opitutae bacterium]
MFFRRTTVLECGASHTALGRFSLTSSGRLRLEDYAVETFALEPGREADWLERTRAALALLRSRISDAGTVVLVLPAHATLVKFIRTPRVSRAQQEKIIRFEAQQSLPLGEAEVVWGSAPAGGTDREAEVMLCAAKHDALEALCAAVEAAGFRIDRALPSPLATLAACRVQRMEDDSPAPVLLANLGARSTTLLLVKPERFCARTFALGGNSATAQIAEGSGRDFAEAEKFKLTDCPRHLLQFAAESFATRLGQEITRSVLHFQRQSGVSAPARILLTGGAARLPGLPELLAAKLGLPVARLAVLDALEIGAAAAQAWAALPVPPVSDLVGAAALQFGRTLPGMDLLPSQLRTRAAFRRRLPWLVAAALLMLAALLPPIMRWRATSAAARQKTAAIEREIAPLRAREARNRANLQRLDELRRQIAMLQGIEDRRVAWLALLADLQDRLAATEDVWLERMSVAPAGGPPPASSAAPLRIAVSGRLLDKLNPRGVTGAEAQTRVKHLLGDLGGSPHIERVEAAHLDRDRSGILQFDFVLVARLDRPL